MRALARCATDDSDVEFEAVSKPFGTIVAVDDITFSVPTGSFFSLLGPSGCGKSTTLRMISGFEHPDQGALRIAGNDMRGVPPEPAPDQHGVSALGAVSAYDGRQNVAFGLEVERLPSGAIRTRVAAMLELVSLADRAHRSRASFPAARCSASRSPARWSSGPSVLLLDEPLGALDLKLRRQLQLELKRIQKRRRRHLHLRHP